MGLFAGGDDEASEGGSLASDDIDEDAEEEEEESDTPTAGQVDASDESDSDSETGADREEDAESPQRAGSSSDRVTALSCLMWLPFLPDLVVRVGAEIALVFGTRHLLRKMCALLREFWFMDSVNMDLVRSALGIFDDPTPEIQSTTLPDKETDRYYSLPCCPGHGAAYPPPPHPLVPLCSSDSDSSPVRKRRVRACPILDDDDDDDTAATTDLGCVARTTDFALALIVGVYPLFPPAQFHDRVSSSAGNAMSDGGAR